MRKIEFYVHTILITVLLVSFLFIGREALFIILIAQFFLGIYQVVVSLFTTFTIKWYGEKTRKMIYIYWFSCTVYAIVLAVLLTVKLNQDVIYYYLIGAWSIALYYYYISYNLAYPNYTKSHLDI